MVSDRDDFEIAEAIAGSVIDSLPAAIGAIDELVNTLEATSAVNPVFLLSVEAMGANMAQLLDSVETRSLEMLPETALVALDKSSGRVIDDLPPALAAINGLVQTLEAMPATESVTQSVEAIHDSAALVLKTLETTPLLQ